MAGENELYPIITEFDGCYEEYSSVSEFKQTLGANFLESENQGEVWVFWRPERVAEGSSSASTKNKENSGRTVQGRVMLALKAMSAVKRMLGGAFSLVQFWSPKENVGRCYLTTMGQPFYVNHLRKGLCWHIKKCMEHEYHVYDGAEDEQLGPPGRVFRNGRPESSPDLLLYSTKEFPLRVHSANCGLRSYYAMPVFDLNYKQCIGVLEFMNFQGNPHFSEYSIRDIYATLKEVDMRSTHTSCGERKTRRDIKAVLELAIKEVPQLHLAQVWVPCKQCPSIGNDFYCMERAIHVTASQVEYMFGEFPTACEFLNLHNGQGIAGLAVLSANKLCFCRNLSAFSIAEYPMAHYVQRSRYSSCFAICVRSSNEENEIYVFEFFLQFRSRDDAYICSIFGLLINIMKNKLNSFEVANGRHLGEKLAADEVQHQYPFEYEIIQNCLGQINQHSNENVVAKRVAYTGKYSLPQVREYFQEPNLSWLPIRFTCDSGWICWRAKGDEYLENRAINNSFLQRSPSLQEKIKFLLVEIMPLCAYSDPSIIQLWAHETIENRSCLSTSSQPFALGQLYKGLCRYRKQCMNNYYYVGNGATDDELGPPGRVFLSGLAESSPNLRLYSLDEFPLRDHLADFRTRRYLALPLFDLYDHEQCIGVLEVVGCLRYKAITKIIEAINMRWKHINFNSRFKASHSLNAKIDGGQKQATKEINEMLELVIKSPQLLVASVWISSRKNCNFDVQMSCMERTSLLINLLRREDTGINQFAEACNFHKVQIIKGVFRRLLESQHKLLLCKNFADFSMMEQPLAHHAQVARLNTYFAICLQSSHMEDSFYVMEFFLSPGSDIDRYPHSYLSFLLSIMKQKLRSFKVASGKRLGSELIFEVEELALGDENPGTSQLGQLDRVGSSRNVVQEERFGTYAMDSANNVEAGEENVDKYGECEVIESSIKRARTITRNSQLPLSRMYEDDIVVMINAKFEDQIMEIQLCLSPGIMAKLVEEVAKRLQLRIGSFKLKYLDEDNDWILLTCDDDFRICMKTLRGKTTVQALVQLIVS